MYLQRDGEADDEAPGHAALHRRVQEGARGVEAARAGAHGAGERAHRRVRQPAAGARHRPEDGQAAARGMAHDRRDR